MEKRITGRAIVPGSATGQAVVSRQPISFWGGISPMTGEVIDRRHDRTGTVVAGKVFVFPTGKGSSTGSAVLMESIKNGVAPAGLVIVKVDAILALGAIVAQELYQKTVPIILISQEDFDQIQDNDVITIQPDGTLRVAAGVQLLSHLNQEHGMRVEHHPILGELQQTNVVEIEVDGQPIQALDGEPIASALLAAGVQVFRFTNKRHTARGIFCGIGRCTDCMMVVDGVPNVRTCVTPVRAGMKVETQYGLGTKAEDGA